MFKLRKRNGPPAVLFGGESLRRSDISLMKCVQIVIVVIRGQFPEGQEEGGECSQAENRSYRLEKETDILCMHPHCPDCLLTAQPYQISFPASPRTIPCHHLAHLPEALPQKRPKPVWLSTVGPASICNTDSYIGTGVEKEDNRQK